MIGYYENRSKNDISVWLLSLSLFLSQFYLWASGLPQFSHILIILALLFFFLGSEIIEVKNLKVFSLFIFYIILVNSFWLLVAFDFSYLISTAYWIFNFLFFLLLVNFNENQINSFVDKILFIIPFSYIVEIMIWFSGLGRYDFYPRYNGLFNDPNQMAFWVLSTSAIFLYISESTLKKIIVYFLAAFLIVLTMSRSATLGFMFLSIGFILGQKGEIDKKIISIILISVFLIGISYLLYVYGFLDNVINRFAEGVEGKDKQAEGRGFMSLLEYPQYLMFGAGQGRYHVYNPVGHEIHSTWLGILFYYGVVGFSLFLIFLYQILRKLKFSDQILFIAPMLYGFTTYSARTSIFWLVLAMFLLIRKNKFYKE